MKRILLPLLALLLSSPVQSSGPEATADFSSAVLPDDWGAVKGEWRVSEGSLVGAELAADKHAAVLNIPDPHAESTIRLRFRLDGAKGFHLSYNHAKGHLCRVTVNAGEAALVMDKDKKNPASKAVTLARQSLSLAPGAWVELSCIIEGGRAVVKIGDTVLEGAHPDLAKEKTGYRLVVQGASVAFDDLAFVSSR